MIKNKAQIVLRDSIFCLTDPMKENYRKAGGVGVVNDCEEIAVTVKNIIHP